MNSGALNGCLMYFKEELKSFMIRELKKFHKDQDWIKKSLNTPGRDAQMLIKEDPEQWDLACLVSLIHDNWDLVFSQIIQFKFPKALFTVVKFYRNMCAHQNNMSERDLYRVIDIMELILKELGLNSEFLEKERLNMLSRLHDPFQNIFFLCQHCKVPFKPGSLYKCNHCFVIVCRMCMRLNFEMRRGFVCYNCPYLLDESEREFCIKIE